MYFYACGNLESIAIQGINYYNMLWAIRYSVYIFEYRVYVVSRT